jgi:hypothetical protein
VQCTELDVIVERKCSRGLIRMLLDRLQHHHSI